MKMKKMLFLALVAMSLMPQTMRAAEDVFADNAYVTIAVTYNGQRYYMGVDTTAATPAIAYYTNPCLGAMWHVGAAESEHATLGAARGLQSAWYAIRESKEMYIKLGTYRNGYFPVEIKENEKSLFYTEKIDVAAGSYLEGYCFYNDVSQSIPTKYYLAFDALYGYARAYSQKPSAMLNMAEWSRKQGTVLTNVLNPHPVVFDYGDTENTISTSMRLELDADFFVNKVDDTERIIVKVGTTIDDQAEIKDLISSITAYWSSTRQAGESKVTGYSKIIPGSILGQIPMFTITNGTLPFDAEEGHGHYHATVEAIGDMAMDVYDANGKPVDHTDWLVVRTEMKDGSVFADSVRVTRRTFHYDYTSPFEMQYAPGDQTVAIEGSALDFVVTGTYTIGYSILYANGSVLEKHSGLTQDVDFSALETTKDTAWVMHVEEEDTTWTHDGEVTEYNQLTFNVKEGSAWMNVSLVGRNTLHVEVQPNVGAENRYGSITFSYNYKNEYGVSTASKEIYINQLGTNAEAAVQFTHNGTLKEGTQLQDVTEKVTTLYALPDAELQLPVWQDMYGWYRWYAYESEKQISILNLTWAHVPQSERGDFYDINTDEAHARGKFEYSPHFDTNAPTDVPSVMVPADFAGGKVACDVSAYTNFELNGFNGQHGSVKEPTLSYRQIFDIHPASEQADRMELCLKSAGSPKWMFEQAASVPQGRTVRFRPSEKYQKTGDTEDSELGYVYYCNLQNQNNVGKKSSVTGFINTPNAYNRIGLARDSSWGGIPAEYRVDLMTYAELAALAEGSKTQVILQAPVQGTGYLVGRNGNRVQRYGNGWATQADAASAALAVVNNPDMHDAFVLTMEIVNRYSNSSLSNYHKDIYKHCYRFTSPNLNYSDYPYYLEIDNYYAEPLYTDNVQFSNSVVLPDASQSAWLLHNSPAVSSNVNRLVKNYQSNALFYMSGPIIETNGTQKFGCFWQHSDRVNGAYVAVNHANHNRKNAFEEINDEDISKRLSASAEYSWQLYKVTETKPAVPGYSYTQQETAKWYITYYAGPIPIKIELGGGGDRGTVNADGTLDYTPRNAGRYQISLETEHFQLCKYTVTVYDPATTYGPSATALISEDDITVNYDVLQDFSAAFAASGKSEVSVLNTPLPWEDSEFGYHYANLDDNRAVASTMPTKGEYALLNMYQKDGVTIESRSGAENGMMLYVNAAKNAGECLSFTYPEPACSDQELFFTCYLRAPRSTAHVNIYLEGQTTTQWQPITTLFSGNISTADGWCQVVLPISTALQESGITMYRMRFDIAGETNGETGLLIDKVRLLAKKRPGAVYQASTTCGNEEVYAISRVVYPEMDASMQGVRLCYQVSYLNADGEYIPMNLEDMPEQGGYYLDGVYPSERNQYISAVDSVNHGFIVVPEPDYDPSASGSAEGQSEALGDFLQMFIEYAEAVEGAEHDAAVAAAQARYAVFIDETSRIYPNVEALCADTTHKWGDPIHVMKGYVKEKIAGVDTWVMYIVMKLDPNKTTSYRMRMTPLQARDVRPYFMDASCGTERFFPIKKMISVNVDGEAVTPGTPLEVAGNTSHSITTSVTVPGTPTYTGSSLFDVIRLPEAMRDYDNLTGDDLVAAENAFKNMHGYSVNEVERAIAIFHAPDENNINRMADRAWEEVSALDFMYAGISEASADSVYAILNHLYSGAHAFFGVKEHTFMIASNQSLYGWVRPVPATGSYVKPNGSSTGNDTTMSIVVCDDNQWLEFHSTSVPHELRFGNDPRTDEEEDLIPVIRATRTQANSVLPVRVSRITNTVGSEVILGWDSTKLIATNDPRWDGSTMTFRYAQDRILQAADYQSGYYHPGDTVLFSVVNAAHITELMTVVQDGKNKWNVPVPAEPNGHPGYQIPNNFELEDGYWYRFQTTMMTLNLSPFVGGQEANGRMGDAFFELFVIPDTMEWVPSNPEGANYWNDDKNWRGIVNGKPTGMSRVPLADSKVIISPQSGEHLYPIVDTDLHGNNDFGFKAATCNDIMFRPGTRINGQELLDYNRCFIDRYYMTGEWVGFSPALKFTRTGDMFTPANMPEDAKSDFAPLTFEDERNRPYADTALGVDAEHFSRDYPYVYYQSYWNCSMPNYFFDTDIDVLKSTTNTTAKWTPSNTLDFHYQPGNGYAVMCYGVDENVQERLLYRLPKQENEYFYYGHNSSTDTYQKLEPAVQINRPTFENQTHNMSFDKDTLANAANAAAGGLIIRLTNQTPGKDFLIGNPSMGNINIWEFVKDNDLEGVVQTIDNSNWVSHTQAASPVMFLSPHDIMLVTIKGEAATYHEFVLKPEHVQLDITIDETPASAPHRAGMKQQGRLTIVAENAGYFGRTLLIEDAASSLGVRVGEDAVAVTSGTQDGGSNGFMSMYTPVSIYTRCQQQALTTDMRPSVNRVPLGFTWMYDMQGDYDEMTRLHFSIQGEWSDPLYLVDEMTGDSVRIVDGGSVMIATPEANAPQDVYTTRYYIRGHAGQQVEPKIDEGGGIVTDLERVEQARQDGKAIVYDMLGRVMGIYQDIQSVPQKLPMNTGVYMIQCGDQTERRVVK